MFDVVAHGQQTHCRRTSGCREQNHAASRARLGAGERGLRGGVLARDRGPRKGCWLPAASRACPAQARVDAPRHGRGKVGSEHVDRPSSRAHSRRVYPRAACEHWGHGCGKTAVGTCIRTGGTLPAKPGAMEFPDVTSLPAAIFSHHFFSGPVQQIAGNLGPVQCLAVLSGANPCSKVHDVGRHHPSLSLKRAPGLKEPGHHMNLDTIQVEVAMYPSSNTVLHPNSTSPFTCRDVGFISAIAATSCSKCGKDDHSMHLMRPDPCMRRNGTQSCNMKACSSLPKDHGRDQSPSIDGNSAQSGQHEELSEHLRRGVGRGEYIGRREAINAMYLISVCQTPPQLSTPLPNHYSSPSPTTSPSHDQPPQPSLSSDTSRFHGTLPTSP